MTWTKERVALLVDLWMSGKSASIVAKEIGNISRNAVIGKVHRLGISNRTSIKKLAQSNKLKKVSSDKIKVKLSKIQRTSKKFTENCQHKEQLIKNRVSNGKINQLPRGYNRQIVLEHDPNATIQFKKLSLLELKENNCRWPSGDPKDNNFHFCGCPTEGNNPYCSYHSKIAYSQTAKRETKQFIIVEQKQPHHNDEFNDNIDIDVVSMKNDNNGNVNYHL